MTSTTAAPPSIADAPAGAAPVDGESAEGDVTSTANDGTRREWNFTFFIKHQAARARVRFHPSYQSQFIDPDDIINLNKLDRDVKHCPMMPFASFSDATIAAQTGAFWEESPKSIRLLYSHIPHDMTLASFCKRSVQHVLSDPRVVSVDGQTSIHRLTVGNKLHNCPRLGGKPSFHFQFILADKIRARSEYTYCLGTIVGQRGYLVTVTCNKEPELHAYIKTHFVPHFCDPAKFELDVTVDYEDTSNSVLKEQQDLYGELHFADRDSAIGFTLPMHPTKIRPDFSPIQSVGVGSIMCMTLELEVNQKLMDDFAEADITGMPKYKVNHVLLFLDVEDVARMGYPGLMSVEQYAGHKLRKLLDVFKDAKTVGMPISLAVGHRCGRSATVTFTYEGFGSVVKAMIVCTLVGNMGISALYFTKLGGGLFDTHLYLYQQVLKSITFLPPREHTERFSRYHALQIRLTDQDLPRCYATAAVTEKKTLERHLKSLHQSTDGKTDGGRVAVVDPSKGGVVRAAAPVSAVSDTAAAERGPAAAFLDDTLDLPLVAAPEGEGDPMLISVSSIPHLAVLPGWDEQVGGQGEIAEAGDTEPPQQQLRAQQQQQPASPEPSATDPAVLAAVVGGEKDGETPAEDPRNAVQTARDSDGAPSTPSKTSVARSGTSPTTRDGATVFPGPTDAAPITSSSAATAAAVADARVNREGLIQAILKEEEELYFGPSLQDVYVRCCELQRCRPNSYLLKKLPSSPRFTPSVEELDLTSNYLGHNGFVAVLQLLEHLPRLHSVFFNEMSLDNNDVEHLCEVLAKNPSIRNVQLRNNPKITLPATKFLSRLLRTNPRINTLGLQGTRIGGSLIVSLEEEARKHRGTSPDAETTKHS